MTRRSAALVGGTVAVVVDAVGRFGGTRVDGAVEIVAVSAVNGVAVPVASTLPGTSSMIPSQLSSRLFGTSTSAGFTLPLLSSQSPSAAVYPSPSASVAGSGSVEPLALPPPEPPAWGSPDAVSSQLHSETLLFSLWHPGVRASVATTRLNITVKRVIGHSRSPSTSTVFIGWSATPRHFRSVFVAEH